MKRLLCLISLIYAVPLAAGMSAQARAGNLNTITDKPATAPSQSAKRFFAQSFDPTGPGAAPPADTLPAPTAPAFPETQVAPAPASPALGSSVGTNMDEAQRLRMQLDGISRQEFDINCRCYGGSLSPGLTIANPSGFGADNNTLFLSGSYQSRIRYGNTSDGELGLGIGLGDARNAIGAEISYSINSFGRSQGFGSGGVNVKLHKKLDDDLGIALGWNRILDVKFGGGTNIPFDYAKNSYYLVGTKVFSTTNNVDTFLSRIALTAGVGGGQFLSERTLQDAFIAGRDPSGLNVFGSAAFRLAKPLSAVVEWTGQDLAAGLSYVPFEGFPLVISPSFRDIAGAGDGSRFVLGTGLQYSF